MNRQWMRERLESFKALCENYEDEGRRTADYTDTMRAISDRMAYQMPTVREILKRLDPTLAQEVTEPQYLSGASDSLRAVQQGLGILGDQDEWAANLTPDAPLLIADQFHPHVWAAASALWDTGQYRVAVGQATVSLSAHIAARSRRVRTYPGSGPRRRKQQVELGERPRAGGRPRAARADAHRGLPREDRTATCSRYSADRGCRRSPAADPAVQAGPRHGGGKTPPGSSGRPWGRLRGIAPNLFAPRCGTSPVPAVAVVVGVLALDLLAAVLDERCPSVAAGARRGA